MVETHRFDRIGALKKLANIDFSNPSQTVPTKIDEKLPDSSKRCSLIAA